MRHERARGGEVARRKWIDYEEGKGGLNPEEDMAVLACFGPEDMLPRKLGLEREKP